jgi:hypothetical protein
MLNARGAYSEFSRRRNYEAESGVSTDYARAALLIIHHPPFRNFGIGHEWWILPSVEPQLLQKKFKNKSKKWDPPPPNTT